MPAPFFVYYIAVKRHALLHAAPFWGGMIFFGALKRCWLTN
jgi:hypothetical protein